MCHGSTVKSQGDQKIGTVWAWLRPRRINWALSLGLSEGPINCSFPESKILKWDIENERKATTF